jgi:photosystem II stability/assembly factor-like uncharacterized protein
MQYTYDAPGVIVKTTDGGDNWNQIWPIAGEIDGLQGIWFTSEQVGFACGWNNYFIKTLDGGATWAPLTVSNDVWYYKDVEFWDPENGIAVATMNSPGNQSAFITADGGNNWEPAASGIATNEVMGISFASQDLVYAVGTLGNIFKSSDGGHNWTTVNTLPAMLLGVDFANDSFGVVGGEEKMFATNDGGTSWTTYTTGYENFYACESFTDGTGYIGGTDDNIYKTTNYGQSWNMDFDGPGESTLYRIRSLANGTIFACGSQGKIIKMTPLLEADFTASQTEACQGSTINFYDNSTGAIDSWLWTFEGGDPAASDLENPVVTYHTPGIYNVELTVTSGINSNTELKTDFITIFQGVDQPSIPEGPAEVCNINEAEYSTPEHSGCTYSWEVTGGTVTSGAGTWQINVLWGNPGEGSVTVTEISEQGCEASSEALGVNIVDCTNIVEDKTIGISIYPNPAVDHVVVSGLDYSTIRIYDLFGIEVLRFNNLNGKVSVNISGLKVGIYIIKVGEREGWLVFRLIKH